MQADTTFATDQLTYGHVLLNTAEQRRSNFESPGGSSAPNLVLNATQTPQTGSLSLVSEQTFALIVFLPV